VVEREEEEVVAVKTNTLNLVKTTKNKYIKRV
jgi:hypothetical protein